jgi:hypothetical protein
MEFDEDHKPPLPAEPRHTRQVPITTSEENTGSNSQGTSMRESSLATWAGPIVAAPLKFVALQAAPLLH